MSEYLEDHAKLCIIRKIAKKHPNAAVDFMLKTIDETWDKEMQRLANEVESKKVAFVTNSYRESESGTLRCRERRLESPGSSDCCQAHRVPSWRCRTAR